MFYILKVENMLAFTGFGLTISRCKNECLFFCISIVSLKDYCGMSEHLCNPHQIIKKYIYMYNCKKIIIKIASTIQ